MKRIERQDDPLESLNEALDGRQAEIWTALPGLVESYDPSRQTATVQPAIQGRVTDARGGIGFVNLPLLVDVPVEFPAGGGFTLTFPVKQGDECVVEFQSRCLDAWWELGGVQQPLESRMHDLSDAVCRVGVRSQPRRLSPGPDAENVQLRTDDGSAHITIKPDYAISLHNPQADCILAADGAVTLKNQAASLEMTPEGAVALENPGVTLHMTPEGQANITAAVLISLTAPVIALNGALAASAGAGGADISSSGSISISAAEVHINEGC